jgi:hypothetical protein
MKAAHVHDHLSFLVHARVSAREPTLTAPGDRVGVVMHMRACFPLLPRP